MLPYRTGTVRVSSPYGWRTLNGTREYHRGIDLVGSDKNIIAVADGVVGVSTMLDRAYDKTLTWQWGNYVRIDCTNGMRMYYCHMSKRLVTAGQRVSAGDVIGIEGNTGYSFGSHLHFEVRDSSGNSVNPSGYIGIETGSCNVQAAPNYAALVCQKCGLESQTRAYIDKYKYAADLWRKLWEGME